MATGHRSKVIDGLQRAVLLHDGAELTDGQLLDCYVGSRDEAAFAALVRRHGPMVWGVCRRLLANYHDAEDAFQTTFLVLVRKAPSIVPRERVANWLYGVAHRTALKAKAIAARRQREKSVTPMPEPAISPPNLWPDLQPLLDAELSRLPDKFRTAMVLCDLEGKTRKEAAQQLGVPEGTIAGWLARARSLLAKRLARRGLAVSGGTLAVVVSQQAASASVPTSVMAGTIKAATLFAAGPATAGMISANVLALTKGVLQAMVLRRIPTAVLVAVGLMGVGGASVTYYHFAAGANEAAIPAALDPTPIRLTWKERFAIKLPANQDPLLPLSAAISPDGKIVAIGQPSGVTLVDAETGNELRGLDPTPTHCTVFSDDGMMLATGHPDTIKIWDVRSGQERNHLPCNAGWIKIAPDGKTLASSEGSTIRLWDLNTGEELRQFKTSGWFKREVFNIAFSPDGTRLASAEGSSPILWDVSTGQEFATFRGHKWWTKATDVAYSPDGKMLASRGGDGTIKLWDIATGKERLSLTSQSRGLAFSPDSRILASAGGPVTEVREGPIRRLVGFEAVPLWNVATGEELAILVHQRPVSRVCFSRDGKLLLSAGQDAVRLWELEIHPSKE